MLVMRLEAPQLMLKESSVNTKIPEVLDWPDVLPTAVALYAWLQTGTACRVKGHTLTLDEHGVWITNPYGCDGLWQELSFERVEAFLADMAMDKEYGPIP